MNSEHMIDTSDLIYAHLCVNQVILKIQCKVELANINSVKMPSLLKAFLARSTIVNGNNLNSVCMGVRRLYQEGTLGRGHLPFPGKLDSHWSLTISITVLKCAKSALISTLKFKMFSGAWSLDPIPGRGYMTLTPSALHCASLLWRLAVDFRFLIVPSSAPLCKIFCGHP